MNFYWREIKGDLNLNKCEGLFVLWIERFKIFIVIKLFYKFNEVDIRILIGFEGISKC